MGGLTAERLLVLGRLRQYDQSDDQALDDEEPIGAVAEDALALRPEGAPGQAPSAGVETDWAKLNAQDRQKGFAFARSRPLGDLMMFRLVLEPMRWYMADQFKIADRCFERSERAKVAMGPICAEAIQGD